VHRIAGHVRREDRPAGRWFCRAGDAANGFDVVFVASLCFALIGPGVLTLRVENRLRQVS
jgi:hypothetical protein